MSPYEFERRKQRLQELINAELLRRGQAPVPPYRLNPYIYRDDEEIIDAEWVEVGQALPAPDKPQNPSPLYIVWFGTMLALTGVLALLFI